MLWGDGAKRRAENELHYHDILKYDKTLDTDNKLMKGRTPALITPLITPHTDGIRHFPLAFYSFIVFSFLEIECIAAKK